MPTIGRFLAMAREKKKLFGCPACGFRVSGTEETCSRCGARFGDRARFECPFCGEPVSPDDVRCPSCMVRFKDFVSKAEKRASDKSIDGLLIDIIEKEAKEVKEQGKKLSCPMCSWLVDGSEEACPKCGIIFSETVAYQCPVCAALVSAETAECGECGSVFLDMEGAEESHAPPGMPDEGPSMEATSTDIAPESVPETRPTPIDAGVAEHPPPETRREELPSEPQPKPREEPAPAESEEQPKKELKVVLRPKIVRKKDIAKPAPPPEKEVPELPVKKVRRRKLRAKPKT